MSYVKHNKIKNTGILYELLSRQITVDVINDTTSPKSVKLFKEFFNKNTEYVRPCPWCRYWPRRCYQPPC